MPMAEDFKGEVLETVTLRFTGTNEDGSDLHELKAVHVAEVLQGLVELTRDFEEAGALGKVVPGGAEILVRPAKEGSFIIEIVRVVQENWEPMVAVGSAAGVPSLSTVIWWATKSARADVQDVEEFSDEEMKITWQDGVVSVVPKPVWKELNKNKRRRRRQLHKIMAAMNDIRVDSLDLGETEPQQPDSDESPQEMVLTRSDYLAVAPTNDVEEHEEVFEAEAQMSAIDFDNPNKWRVKAMGQTRSATVEDEYFLGQVARGLAIRKTDIFTLRMREDTVVKNGRTSKTWTVLVVSKHRRASGDDDTTEAAAPEA